MRKHSKMYVEALGNIDKTKNYDVTEAIKVLKSLKTRKFDESVDLVLNLNIDAKKTDQNIRGSFVLPNGTGKTKRVLVVTKYDLCDKGETNKILEKYKKMCYNVVTLDLIGGSVNELIQVTKNMMKPINEERVKKGLRERASRILIVGAPNVGKSTLINRLVGKKSVGVGNTPGFTKSLSWIRINKDMELLDSPGILWPKIENQENAHVLAAFSSIKEEILNIDDIACFILNKMEELYPEKLKERYGIDKIDEDFMNAYEMIGKKRGVLSRGGVVDYEKVSVLIIQDLKNGAFGPVTFDRL